MVVSHIFDFSPLFGEDSQFDEYFSDGLKPPTSLYGSPEHGTLQLETSISMLNLGRVKYVFVLANLPSFLSSLSTLR